MQKQIKPYMSSQTLSKLTTTYLTKKSEAKLTKKEILNLKNFISKSKIKTKFIFQKKEEETYSTKDLSLKDSLKAS